VASIIIDLGGAPLDRDAFGDPNEVIPDPSGYPEQAYTVAARRGDAALRVGQLRERRGVFITETHPAFSALKYVRQ
jgi:hypothetical protein